MIDFYFFTTPNGYKIGIFLEEAGLPYKVHSINITKDEQFAPDFLKISPNNKIPAIVDQKPADGKGPLSIFESGAILWYLAEKTKMFVPEDAREKALVSQWLFWQVGGLGPMAGQNHHFSKYAKEKIPYAIERYQKETARLYSVLNKRLEEQAYVAGEYSIADMAIYPWVVPHKMQAIALEDYPAVSDWFERVRSRPAVQSAYQIKV